MEEEDSGNAKINWCFTLNNYTNDDIIRLKTATPCHYMICGLEVGEDGTPHVQGYIQLLTKKRFEIVKKLISRRAHIEIAKGSAEQNIKYCSKDGNFFILPTADAKPREKRQRSDILDVKKKLDDGASLKSIADSNFPIYIRNQKNLQQYKMMVEESRKTIRNIETTILWGDSRTGKTGYVYNNHNINEIFKLDSANKLWWDGYNGQKILLIDDFYGDWIKYSALLNILDKYPLRCEIKGGFTYANWTTVYITSNKHPSEWYSEGMTDAFKNRINFIKYFRKMPIGNANRHKFIDETPEYVLKRIREGE